MKKTKIVEPEKRLVTFTAVDRLCHQYTVAAVTVAEAQIKITELMQERGLSFPKDIQPRALRGDE